MKKTPPTMIKIIQPKKQSNLSKAQKLFNKLVKKIDTARSQLIAWQTLLPAYQQKYSNEFLPAVQSFDKYLEELVRLFDKVWSNKLFNKSDKAKLGKLICDIAAQLLEKTDNAELKEIYNRHSQGDFDAEMEEEKEAVKSMMGSMFGIDLGDDIDLRLPEKMMAQFAEKMQQRFLQEERTQKEIEEQGSKRKKSAKSLAKDVRQQEEAHNVSQSIREVYRKLASALHPDREQDCTERERKTALMQRVNTAYDKKNLLELLELQLEVEQIDQSMIRNISEDRLKHYNKILTEQSEEIRCEIATVEFSFRMRFSISPEEHVSPAFALHKLECSIKAIQEDIDNIQHDLAEFDSIPKLKKWIKGYRVRPRSFHEEELFDEMDMEMLFGSR